jgi:hypothetical protein
MPLVAPSWLCFAPRTLNSNLPPTGRPDQLPACTGACAPPGGWMYTVPQGAQQPSVVRLKVESCAAGARQHQVCTSTVTSHAWPGGEDSTTTVQLLPSRLSAQAPQCDGVQRLAWRATYPSRVTSAAIPQCCMTSLHAAPSCRTPLRPPVHLPHTRRCASTLDVGQTGGHCPHPVVRHR